MPGLARIRAGPRDDVDPGGRFAGAGRQESEHASRDAAPPDAGAGLLAPDFGDYLPRRWYAGAEYLLWWFKDSPLPVPLLTTTSNPNDMPLAVIGDPNTSVLLGEQGVGSGVHQGAHITAGFWIDDRRQIAVEGGYFFLAGASTTRSFASDGGPTSPVLAVPFFDEDAAAESSFVLASPGAFAGAAALTVTSRLQGAEVHGVVQAFDADDLHVEVLFGGRFIQLTENLSFATASTGLSDPNTDLVLNTVDQFDTRNSFYGWQVGARGGWAWEGFEVQATAKLALGQMHETMNLNGAAVTNFSTASRAAPSRVCRRRLCPDRARSCNRAIRDVSVATLSPLRRKSM